MSEADRRQPDVSPLYAALHGLPPARFVVGTLDPLLDDTLFMEARWWVGGARTQLEVVPDAVHGFTAHPTTAARLAKQSEAAFVRASVAAAPST
jgi:acetyl esterase